MAAALSPTQAAGGAAEETAARFLERQGLAIVARNFRTRMGEIDLVARDGATLVFVEVRLRSASGLYGGAAASIDANKRSRLIAAARMYLARIRGDPPCRFDVVTIEGGQPQWIKAAFEVG